MDFQESFTNELESTFGDWDKNGARFGNMSYGDIADKLCISGSQFSKLLYGSATNGMYERSIRNIKQLQQLDNLSTDNIRLQDELSRVRDNHAEIAKNQSINYRVLTLVGVLFFFIGCTFYSFLSKGNKPTDTLDTVNLKQDDGHILAPFFDREFKDEHISPFLDISDAQAYCPGSAFEGEWHLDKEYTIPIPLKKPGLYYLAKDVDLRMKCFRSVEPEQKGKVLLGFESMVHELWIDTKREPLTPKYFNADTKNYTKAFYNINFSEDDSFKKIATIQSFFFNMFEIEGDKIIRKGEPAGRFAKNIDHELVNQYEVDIKYVLEDVIGNMVKTQCSSANNEYCNPNTLVENESTIKFDCDFTIHNENLGLGGSYPYSKIFKLVKQNYSANLLCNCDS